MPEPMEKDFLQYKGNTVPRVIRLAWTALIVFTIFYLSRYAWPDLMAWLQGKS